MNRCFRPSSIVLTPRLLKLAVFAALFSCLIAPTGRAATNITIIASGTGNLDSFLSATNGTITTANDSGDTAAKLSKAALQGVGPGVPISIAADSTITFQDVGTLSLQTGLGVPVTFQTTSGAISFMNAADTLSTSGAIIQFSAGTDLTVCNLSSMGGDVTLTAGTAGAGNLQFGTILTQGSGNLTFQAGGGTIAQTGAFSEASGLSISATAMGNITVNSLRGTSVGLTSYAGSIFSAGSSAIQASSELTLSSATGILLNTSAAALQASNSTSGNVTITQIATPVQTLTITGSGFSNNAPGGSISITNLADSIVVNSLTSVVSSNGSITLAASGLQLSGTVNSGSAATTLANSNAGTQIDVGTNTVGKLSLLQSDLNNVTASVLRIGSLTAGSLNVSTAITNPGSWSGLALINGGAMTEGAGGSLTLPNLRVSSAGPVTLTSVNNVGVLAASTSGAFSFWNGTHTLVIGSVDFTAGISTVNSMITLNADNLSLTQPVNAGTGIVTLIPFTLSLQVNLGSASAPGTSFGLTDAQLGQVTAGVLRIGSAADSGGLAISNPITRHAGFSTLSLLNGGGGSQTAALSVANLCLQFNGTTVLVNAVNSVDTLAVNDPSANVSFNDAGALVIGTVDGISGVNLGLTVTFALRAGGAVSQTANINTPYLELLGGGSYNLNNPGNSTTYLAASVTGGISYTNAGTLYVSSVAGIGVTGATGVTSSVGSVSLNTVAGPMTLSFTVAASAPGQTVSLTAGGTDNVLDLAASPPTIAANSKVTLSADRILWNFNNTITTATGGSNVVQLEPVTSGRPLNIDNTDGLPTGELRLTTADLNLITTDILRLGDLGTTGNLTVKSAVANGTGWSTLSLLTGISGVISQLAAITVTNLQAAGAGGVTLTNAANSVAILAGASLGGFSFTNNANLTVGNVDPGLGSGFGSGIMTGGGAINVNLAAASGFLTLGQPVNATGFSASGGANINLTADNMAFSAAVNGGTGGIVTLAPFTTSRTISLGGPNSGTQLGITDALLGNITGGAVRLGGASQTGFIRVDSGITRHAGYNTLSLIATGAGGAIAENIGTVSVANLALKANAGIGSGTSLQVVGPINVAFQNTSSGAVGISSAGAMTIAAVDSVSPSFNNGTSITLAAFGPLTFAVNVTSASTITASTTETSSESGSPLPAPDDDITVNPGIMVLASLGIITFNAADKINIGTGAVVTGVGLFYTNGNGDNDNDCLSPLPSSSISAPSGGMGPSSFPVSTYGSVCHWLASSDSPTWLTTSSTGTGSGSVSYTVAANTLVAGRVGHINVGGQVFTVTQSGVLPTNLVTTPASSTSISLTWTSSAVDHFEVWKNAGSGYSLLAAPTTNSYTDSSLATMTAFEYKVRAVDNSSPTPGVSAFTNSALGATIVFTDEPLTPGVTIKAIHLTQLRQAVTAVSTLAHTGAPTFTDPSPAGVFIKLVHVAELRNALDAARSALGDLAPLSYSSITIGSPVSAVDFTQIYNGVK